MLTLERAQASVDSLVQHLQDALSMAKEDVVRLQHQVLQLQTQATELLEANLSQSELSYDPSTMAHENLADIRGTRCG
jgi:TolA-binding protein